MPNLYPRPEESLRIGWHKSVIMVDIIATLCKYGDAPLFKDHCHFYKMNDETFLGDVKWNSFVVRFLGEIPNIPDVPTWMT